MPRLYCLGFILACLTLGASCYSRAGIKTEISCDDLLKKYATELAQKAKITHLESKPGSGQKVCQSSYRISGKEAAEIEIRLRQDYKMNELVFVCCGWEVKQGKLGEFLPPELIAETGAYRHYSISLHSQETLIKNRIDWYKIPFFYIRLEIVDI